MASSIVKQTGPKVKVLSSVSRSLGLLDILAEEPQGLTLAEVSRRVGLPKSSVYRMLVTLEAAGLLERDAPEALGSPGAPAGRYRLGLKLLQLAGRVQGRHGLREIAAPFMQELSRLAGEVIHLAVLDGAEIVYLEKKGQGQVLTVATRVGGRNPAYASAMGKVLLAGLDPQSLDRLLQGIEFKPLTANTIREPEALRVELGRVRRLGRAFDNEEMFPGIRCVAAPVRDAAGRVAAALSATVPSQRMGRGRARELGGMVAEAAARISRRMLECRTEGTP